MIRKVLVAGAVGAMTLVGAAAPANASGITVPIRVNGVTQSAGSATITRTGGDFAITVSLNSGSSFSSVISPNLQICASTAPISAKENKTACTALAGPGQYFQFPESGSTAAESISTGFTSGTVYLQIHADINLDGNAQTSMACGTSGAAGDTCGGGSGDAFWGSVAVGDNGTEVPVGAIGAVGLSLVLGVGFVLLQRRSRRRLVAAA